jgi:nicotinate phosphoribosyltransferase
MPPTSALSTDLYELTMAAAYFESGIRQRATFELFARSLPRHRSYLIVAGLEQALDYLATLHFERDEIEFLRAQPVFKHVRHEFFDYLSELRFTGDVWAMPEGTVAFANEPVLRVTAPIIEAQIVETFLLATINFQTMIATKASQVVTAAQGRNVVDFGTRRAHGPQAGMLAARAAFIGGCTGTSNVEASHRFGIPIFGTLAHSFIMAFDDEEEAFRAFLKVFPDAATILVDTYDTIAAVKLLAQKFGPAVPAVRLDSGDLVSLSKQVRQILDGAGMTNTKIFSSGDLNEHSIAELLKRGAPIDGFGVGTQLTTSYDSPALGGVYKLVSIAGAGSVKLSRDKATYPLPKQVWRHPDFARDLVAAEDEPSPGNSWQPLIERVDLRQREPLVEARARAAEQLNRLPPDLRALDSEANYPVEFSKHLEDERRKLQERRARSG